MTPRCIADMVRHKVVDVTEAVQNLATALALSGAGTHCSFFSLQALGANGSVVWLGGATDTLDPSTNNYGIRLEIPVSTVPSAPFFRESRSISGYLDLADWQFQGTGIADKVSVMWDACP